METLAASGFLDGFCYLAESTMTTAMEARPFSPRELQEKRQQFLMAIEPYLKAKAEIYAFSMPTYTLHKNGDMTTEYHFTDAQKACIAKIDECIRLTERIIYRRISP